jgi:hypothetical protein
MDRFGVRHWENFCDIYRVVGAGEEINVSHPKCWKYNQRDHNQAVEGLKEKSTPLIEPTEISCPEPKEN